MLTALTLALFLPRTIQEKWVYLATNLLVDENVEKDIELLKRAKAAGYTGFVVSDSKFTRWEQLPDRYKTNAKRFRDAVQQSGLKFVACVAPVGYSNDLLAADPNLAEGLPVRKATFIVTPDRKLVPEPDNAGLKNGDFEAFDNASPKGWAWVDAPGTSTFADHAVVAEGRTSLRMQDPVVGSPDSGNCRASQSLKVQPFHYYHVSFKLKTQDLDNPASVEAKAIGANGQSLSFRTLPTKRSMDWTKFDMTFNSLENTEVNIYFGIWGGKKGTLWWDDIHVEPGGFVNLVRRGGAPLTVTSLDGDETYKEGTDFSVVKDLKMGNVQWPGDFDVWHDQPLVTVLANSRLEPAFRVAVSYYHTALIYDGQAMVCMSEPKTVQLLDEQINLVKKHLDPDGYMLSHDEIRMTGYDQSCEQSTLSPSQILAKNTAHCIQAIRKADPGKTIYAWSDMFDPQHNAAKDGYYYLVKGKGPWYGSWSGLDKTVVVFNWNSDPQKRKASLEFFEKRGNPQILAGYYDGPVESIKPWMADASGVSGYKGVMYTTWVGDYSNLERFAEVTH